MARTVYAVIIIGLVCLAGCGEPVPIEPIIPNSAGLSPKVDYSKLDMVLGKVITRDHLVSWVDLDENISLLDAQLALLAITGPSASPELLPTEESRLAYWYNVGAAWAMKLVKVCDLKKELSRPEVLNNRPFRADGRLMSLSDIDTILAGDSCWQTLVAAPCVCFERAAMPRHAFSAEGIRDCIATRFQDFIADNRRMVVDVDNRCVLAPKVIWNLRTNFILQYEQTYHTQDVKFLTALLPHLHGDALRKMQDASGYDIQLRPPTLHIARTGRFDFWPKR